MNTEATQKHHEADRFDLIFECSHQRRMVFFWKTMAILFGVATAVLLVYIRVSP